MKSARNASGNVLFLILIAVALFAALPYSVTKSSRGGGRDVSKDKLKLDASQIIQYTASIEQTIQRLMLINKCTESQISFVGAALSSYSNSNSPADKRCHVFDPAGGNLHAASLPEKYFVPGCSQWSCGYYIYSSAMRFKGVGSDNIPSGGSLDLHILITGLTVEMCNALNNAFKIYAPIPSSSSFRGGFFRGTYNHVTNLLLTAWPGKYSGCFYHSSGTGSEHLFYHTLLAR